MDIENTLKFRRSELTRKLNENDLIDRQATEAEEAMLKAAEDMQLSTEALEFLEEVANSRRGSMKGRIESVLTEALQLVYGPTRSIEMTYAVKNNRSHLNFDLVKQTKAGEVRRVLDGKGAGLGVSDTVSVPLRLLVLMGERSSDRVCALDECYKHVDKERILLVVQFLHVLTERLGMQVIMLSHHEELRDKVDASWRVSEGAEASKVERVI